jgi:hypothetical protein
MKRRSQRTGSEPSASAVARENARIKAILQAQLALHPDASSEADELLAASEKDVLAVVYLNAADLERGGAAAEQTASFEELDSDTGLLQAQGRRKAGQATANDGYRWRGVAGAQEVREMTDGYALESHDRTTTRSFSVFESAARAFNGSPGSRSIFFNSSS